jgi:hypothetical protein
MAARHILYFLLQILPQAVKYLPTNTLVLTKSFFLQKGTARVHLGDAVRDVQAGATIFIPANTWIAVSNIGIDTISAVCVFSAPGFEEFMREGSVREGEKNVPITEAEDAASQKRHSHDVIYKQP